MQNRTLSLSLLMSAALAIPSLAMAADADEMTNVTSADMRTTPVDNTLQAEVEGPDGELLATQPGAIETNEAEAVAMADMGDEVEVSEDMADDVDMDSDANVVQAEALQPAQTSQALNMQHSNPDYQPLLSGENATGEQAADTAITLQEKEKDSRGELLATQPADIEANESRRISVR